MDSRCWICEQKAEYKKERLDAIMQEAKQKANANQETYAIWKEGTLYKCGTISEAEGHNVITHVSKHNDAST